MNRRTKRKIAKKTDQIKRARIHEMLDLILDINGGVRTSKQTLTGDEPTAFFEYSGHVNGVKVEVFLSGWCAGAKNDICIREYFDGALADENKIMQSIDTLRKLAATA